MPGDLVSQTTGTVTSTVCTQMPDTAVGDGMITACSSNVRQLAAGMTGTALPPD